MCVSVCIIQLLPCLDTDRERERVREFVCYLNSSAMFWLEHTLSV